MYALTFAYLLSPNWPYTPPYCTYAQHCGDFSLFSIFARTKSRKKQIIKVTFFPLDVFNRHFLYFLLISVFVFLRGCIFLLICFWCFCCFWWVQSLFVRIKNKGFKTALITSFILLLNLSYYKHEFFIHYNLF